jgi:hypothetical protein
MMYECEICGAALDPGEKCSCQASDQSSVPALQVIRTPVISEALDSVTHQLNTVLATVEQLQANDSSLKQVKAIRAELAKQFQAMEQQRKAAKKQVMEPYLQAEAKYKAAVAEPYQEADKRLKAWVDNYQDGLKAAKEQELREYFEELCAVHGVDFLRFEDAGVAVDMAMARQNESRKTKEKLESFVLRVRADMNAIMDLDAAAEVLAEYRKLLDLPEAILTVKRRRAAVYQMATLLEYGRIAQQETQKASEQLLAAAPELRDQLPQEDTYTITFTVTGTLPELKALKAYILTRNLTIEEDEHEQ